MCLKKYYIFFIDTFSSFLKVCSCFWFSLIKLNKGPLNATCSQFISYFSHRTHDYSSIVRSEKREAAQLLCWLLCKCNECECVTTWTLAYQTTQEIILKYFLGFLFSTMLAVFIVSWDISVNTIVYMDIDECKRSMQRRCEMNNNT